MKLKQNLQREILVKIITPIILAFVILGVFIGNNHKKLTRNQIQEYLKTNTFTNAEKLKLTFEKQFNFTDILSEVASEFYLSDSNTIVENLMKNYLAKNNEHYSAWLLWDEKYISMNGEGTQGWILAELKQSQDKIYYNKNILLFHELFGDIVESKTRYYSSPYLIADDYYINLSSPILGYGGKIVGFAGVSISLNFLNSFIEKNNIYKHGFLTVIGNNGMFLGHINSTLIGKTFEQNFPLESINLAVSDSISKGKNFLLETYFAKNTYYSFFAPVYFDECPKPMSVEVTIPINKMMSKSDMLINQIIIIGIIAIVMMMTIIWLLSKKISMPIKRVTAVLQKLEKGNTKNISELKYRSNDELKAMADSLNNVIIGMKNIKDFAMEIGKGNLEQEYKLLSEYDQLGKSLIEMRDTLKTKKEEEKIRKEESNIKSWTNIGIAKFSEILRQDNNNLKKLSLNFISNLVDYLKINQAALFALNNDMENDKENNQEKYFELISAVAYDTDKYMEKKIKIGEGLVGRCAYEKKTILLTEVPDNYYTITSGLGTANPNCILLVPCVFNDIVFSVLEMASFKTFEKHEIEFVELLAESIASTISTTQINERTTLLLHNSQIQKEELIAQEEELRQNLEEMQTTQENIQRKIKENKEIKVMLENEKSFINNLLDNIPEQIYFKDKKGRYLQASKSILKQLDAKYLENIVGKTDFDFLEKNIAQEKFDKEQYIIDTLNGFKNKEIENIKTNGKKEWLSVTKLPVTDNKNQLLGIVSISKNITKLKNLEIRLKNKEQELNDFINILKQSAYSMEYNTEGFVTDVNEPFVELLKSERDKIIGQHHSYKFDMEEMSEQDYKDFWNDLVTNGLFKRKISLIEIEQNKIWLSETYIPIYNEEKEIHKVLKIAFDVTNFITNN